MNRSEQRQKVTLLVLARPIVSPIPSPPRLPNVFLPAVPIGADRPIGRTHVNGDPPCRGHSLPELLLLSTKIRCVNYGYDAIRGTCRAFCPRQSRLLGNWNGELQLFR